MSIDEIEAAANRRLFGVGGLSVPATVTPRGGAPIPTRIIIDRDATITDDFGIVLESRCEIGVLTEEVGRVDRGTLIDTGKPDDRWTLLEPIGDDGFEQRWTASRY
ncbi:head-tail joining protein [Cobetia marina]